MLVSLVSFACLQSTSSAEVLVCREEASRNLVMIPPTRALSSPYVLLVPLLRLAPAPRESLMPSIVLAPARPYHALILKSSPRIFSLLQYLLMQVLAHIFALPLF